MDKAVNKYLLKTPYLCDWATQTLEDENKESMGVQIQVVAPAKFGEKKFFAPALYSASSKGILDCRWIDEIPEDNQFLW